MRQEVKSDTFENAVLFLVTYTYPIYLTNHLFWTIGTIQGGLLLDGFKRLGEARGKNLGHL